MPYGTRLVEGASIDFDAIYSTIFRPAIQRVTIQGDKRLIARRSDEVQQSRLLLHSMFRDLLESRLALADLTSHNPNVLYELGIRQSFVGSGTAVVRMKGVQIPFDLAHVAVTEYKNDSATEVKTSVSSIAKVLRATLRYNEVDSPVYEHARDFVNRMGTPDRPTEFGKAVVTAEEAALTGDVLRANQTYLRAAHLEPSVALLHQRRGSLLLRDHAPEAILAFREAQMAGLPESLRADFLRRLPGSPPDLELANMVMRSKPLPSDAIVDVAKQVRKDVGGQDQVKIEIQARRDAPALAVRVISPVAWESTGAVWQALYGSGQVADKGRVYFADMGRVAHYYEVTPYQAGFGSSNLLANNIATGLKGLQVGSTSFDVKIGGGGGRGGFGGSGGSFGGAF